MIVKRIVKVISTRQRDKEKNIVGIYWKLITNLIESNRAQILFYRPMQSKDKQKKSKYYLDNYFNIEWIKHPYFIYIIWLKMNPESLSLESLLDPRSNLPNFLNPNHVLNTLISPGYSLINSHTRHIAPPFITQASKLQKGVTIWITSLMNSSS